MYMLLYYVIHYCIENKICSAYWFLDAEITNNAYWYSPQQSISCDLEVELQPTLQH